MEKEKETIQGIILEREKGEDYPNGFFSLATCTNDKLQQVYKALYIEGEQDRHSLSQAAVIISDFLSLEIKVVVKSDVNQYFVAKLLQLLDLYKRWYLFLPVGEEYYNTIGKRFKYDDKIEM